MGSLINWSLPRELAAPLFFSTWNLDSSHGTFVGRPSVCVLPSLLPCLVWKGIQVDGTVASAEALSAEEPKK